MPTDHPDLAFDLVIRNGQVFDGSGGEPVRADVAVTGDRVAMVGQAEGARAGVEIDAAGLAVAPGFINVLSHSYFSILQDGRSLGELKQGVTTQVFGEGWSMGPVNERTANFVQKPFYFTGETPWTSLAGYLDYAEHHGVSQNVASYIGQATLRSYVAGFENRLLTAAEFETLRALIRDEMTAGALGIGAALIYPPAFFADTNELIELCRAAAPHGGRYIAHMRNESLGLLEGIDELVRIAREAGVPAESYHLKAGGQVAWPLMSKAVERIEAARAEGLAVTADMYTYTAGATGLSNCIPPWFHEGGPERLYERLGDRAIRAEMRKVIETVTGGWENFLWLAGTPENVLLLSFNNPDLRHLQGKTLAEASLLEGSDPIETIFDLVQRDRSRIGTAYFLMSEENVTLGLRQPWVSIGSDASSMAPEGAFLEATTHPRAYGCFARFLGKYVREERLVPLAEAVRRMTSLPAENLGLDRRGRIKDGYFADLVIFHPDTVADRATYADPHQYAVGVRDVVVNGRVALRDGEFAGVLAGRALYGPGKRDR